MAIHAGDQEFGLGLTKAGPLSFAVLLFVAFVAIPSLSPFRGAELPLSFRSFMGL